MFVSGFLTLVFVSLITIDLRLIILGFLNGGGDGDALGELEIDELGLELIEIDGELDILDEGELDMDELTLLEGELLTELLGLETGSNKRLQLPSSSRIL